MEVYFTWEVTRGPPERRGLKYWHGLPSLQLFDQLEDIAGTGFVVGAVLEVPGGIPTVHAIKEFWRTAVPVRSGILRSVGEVSSASFTWKLQSQAHYVLLEAYQDCSVYQPVIRNFQVLILGEISPTPTLLQSVFWQPDRFTEFTDEGVKIAAGTVLLDNSLCRVVYIPWANLQLVGANVESAISLLQEHLISLQNFSTLVIVDSDKKCCPWCPALCQNRLFPILFGPGPRPFALCCGPSSVFTASASGPGPKFCSKLAEACDEQRRVTSPQRLESIIVELSRTVAPGIFWNSLGSHSKFMQSIWDCYRTGKQLSMDLVDTMDGLEDLESDELYFEESLMQSMEAQEQQLEQQLKDLNAWIQSNARAIAGKLGDFEERLCFLRRALAELKQAKKEARSKKKKWWKKALVVLAISAAAVCFAAATVTAAGGTATATGSLLSPSFGFNLTLPSGSSFYVGAGLTGPSIGFGGPIPFSISMSSDGKFSASLKYDHMIPVGSHFSVGTSSILSVSKSGLSLRTRLCADYCIPVGPSTSVTASAFIQNGELKGDISFSHCFTGASSGQSTQTSQSQSLVTAAINKGEVHDAQDASAFCKKNADADYKILHIGYYPLNVNKVAEALRNSNNLPLKVIGAVTSIVTTLPVLYLTRGSANNHWFVVAQNVKTGQLVRFEKEQSGIKALPVPEKYTILKKVPTTWFGKEVNTVGPVKLLKGREIGQHIDVVLSRYSVDILRNCQSFAVGMMHLARTGQSVY